MRFSKDCTVDHGTDFLLHFTVEPRLSYTLGQLQRAVG